jgi:hypothetical protein
MPESICNFFERYILENPGHSGLLTRLPYRSYENLLCGLDGIMTKTFIFSF